jgi:glyoxylase-like metal-dependent hydrolase (beta-lactamase superfamily II)
MKKLTEDLWQSTIHTSGMLSCHAYYLKTSQGNFLIYNTGNESDLAEIAALGGVDYQLITHRDEAAPSLSLIKDKFSSKLVCSEFEQSFLARHASVDIALDVGDHEVSGIQILHTPGHTGGSICFYFKSPTGNNYLFTGDTIFQWESEWATLVISGAGGNSEDLTRSLLKLKSLSPNFVISSGFIKEKAFVEIEPCDWGGIIDTVSAKL